MTRPRVEILCFDGCPNVKPTRALVARVAAELGVDPEIELVVVPDVASAARLRFLGSPTVRVDGADVEPGADERADFVFSCRIYPGEHGPSGQPVEAWIRDAFAPFVTAEPHGDAVSALAAAGIPPAKLGAARTARLTDPERELYVWILRSFATVGRPRREDLLRGDRRSEPVVAGALASFARDDLVHLDHDGEIAVAYPFSGRATAHRVRFANGHEAFAMCALDALGIAPMLEETIVIASADPSSGEEIEVRLTPSGTGEWFPRSAVVVAGREGRAGDSCDGCCPVLNFFSSPGNAQRWLDEHPAVHGEVIAMPDAIAAGRIVFGDALTGV